MLATHNHAPNNPKQSVARKWRIPLGRPPSIENRHPSELEIDDSYQRTTEAPSSQLLIRKIANGWDWRMCLPLVVSKREDAFYVIDGQHRLAAAKLRGDIPYLPCCISTYGSVADEAAMFVAMNRTRKAIGQLDDFHASIASGDADAIAIEKLVRDAGLTISRTTRSQSWAPGAVSFTSSILMVRRRHGDDACSQALAMIAKAFPGQVLKAGAPIFRALVKLTMSGEAPDRERLIRALSKETQLGWASYVSGVAKGVEDRAGIIRQAILMAYEDVGREVYSL